VTVHMTPCIHRETLIPNQPTCPFHRSQCRLKAPMHLALSRWCPSMLAPMGRAPSEIRDVHSRSPCDSKGLQSCGRCLAFAMEPAMGCCGRGLLLISDCCCRCSICTRCSFYTRDRRCVPAEPAGEACTDVVAQASARLGREGQAADGIPTRLRIPSRYEFADGGMRCCSCAMRPIKCLHIR